MNTQPLREFAGSAYAWRARRGVALVIVLAFVVMLSGVVIAFFSRAVIDRQVSNSSASRAKADMFARGAADQIIGDLKQEITDGSSVTSVGTGSIYVPDSPADMVPRLAGSSGTGGLENLVKRSARGVQFSTGANASDRAANVSSLDPSLNNRAMTPSRWNKPLFLPTSGTSVTDLTPSGAFDAPDWILVARDGSNPTAWNAKLVTSPANSSTSVFGRYAYTIYDEGGLLDVNAVGYPLYGEDIPTANPPYTNKNSDPAAAYKGVLAFADLTQLPGFYGSGVNELNDWNSRYVINNLVGWRHYASLGMPTSPHQNMWGSEFKKFKKARAEKYTQLVLNNTTGFLSPMTFSGSSGNSMPGRQTDQMFVTRQQLIKFFTQAIFSPATSTTGMENMLKLRTALPYLTHFTREVNSPSWGPSTPVGSSIDYKGQMDAATSANRFLPGVVAKGPVTRADGTAAKSGEPLIKSRFPLSRLAGLGPTGPVVTGSATTMLNGLMVPATDATVQRDFGIAWDTANNCWNYVGHSGTTLVADIKTLDQVASENREPNFFELLKAGILSGSLGKDGGGGWSGTDDPNAPGATKGIPSRHEQDKDFQILQIGANLIDQFDADSYPTPIRIDRAGAAWEAVGIEHLPYLAQYKPIGGLSPDNAPLVATYFLVNLWNPHRATPAPPTTRPDVRLHIKGTLNLFIDKTGPQGDWMPTTYWSFQEFDVVSPSLSAAGRDGYLNPGILTAGDAGLLSSPGTTAGMQWVETPSTLGSYAAFRLKDFDPSYAVAPRTRVEPYNGRNKPDETLAVQYSANTANPFQIMLEYKDASGAWRAYSLAHGINDDPALTWRKSAQAWVTNGAPTNTATAPSPQAFSASALATGAQVVTIDPRTRRFTSMLFGGGSTYSGLFTGSLWPTTWPTGYGSGTMASMQLVPRNIWQAGRSTFPALLCRNNNSASQYKDADGVTRLADSGYFTGDANSGNPFFADADRPVILNRPFRSVAELGYASRDMPFRSLDFFTDKSPDAALFDLFAISETATSMRAGVVNLNTRQAPVLQAVLAGTVRDIAASGTNLASTDATTVASALASSAAITNPAQLAERIAAISTLGNRKVERETIARALAGTGQTRTWNLMIDVIAQTGRYPQPAKELKDFLVEGERRYWVHVAIDRFTGQVIDSQFEPVQE